MSDNNRRVLVVEDDKTSARMLYNLLTSKGIEADEVHNGKKALEKINIFNITDHSDIKKGPEVKVNCSISLPVN